ncbi:MAG: Proteasome subunit beta type-5 [Cercozoa sp. M6MM]
MESLGDLSGTPRVVLPEHTLAAEQELLVKQASQKLPSAHDDFHPSKFQQDGIDYEHGTTTLGFVFKGGVMLCVDSRASMGSFIASNRVKKIIEINPFLLGTMAGGAADCMYWERVLSVRCRLFELENKQRISVRAASKILSNIVYSYRGRGLSMGTMVAGWDANGPQLFYVDSDGTRLQHHLFSVGSGSTFAYGVLDTEYKYDMTEEEAHMVARRAIYHATHRDAASGGVCQCYVIRKDGWERLSACDSSIIEGATDEYANNK